MKSCKDIDFCDCGCRETACIVSGSLFDKDPCLKCTKQKEIKK